MSTIIRCNGSTVAIPKENICEIIDLLNLKYERFKSRNAEELMDYLYVDYTEENDEYLIDFYNDEHYESELRYWEDIGAFVKDNTYAEFINEDGELYRIVFRNGKAEYIYPKIVWDM